MKKTKVVQLTSVHAPFDTRIFYKECMTLAAAGYEVVLIAPHESDEVADEIRIRMVPIPKSRLERMLKTTWQIFRAALIEHADVYHFHDPELIPVGLLLKLLGKHVIYDVHEEVRRDILTKPYIRSMTMRKLIACSAGVIELLGSTFFDRVLAATPAIAKQFPENKTVIVQNFPILAEPASVRIYPYCDRPSLITYVGDITPNRGIKEIVLTMNLLPQALGIRLGLAGTFRPPALESEVRQLPGWKFVDFLGWQSREGVNQLLANARVGLVVLNPTPSYAESYPSKMFEYMSFGIPVIASNFPLWRRIVEETGCGILVDPLNPKAIAETIVWLFENPKDAEAMGLRGRQAVSSRYNWDNEARKLVNLYGTLLFSGPGVKLDGVSNE